MLGLSSRGRHQISSYRWHTHLDENDGVHKVGSPWKKLRYIVMSDQKEWRETKVLEERTRRNNGAADIEVDEVKRYGSVRLVALIERRRR